MKKTILFLVSQLLLWQLHAQNLIVQSGSSFKTYDNVYLVLSDLGIDQQGTTDLSGSNVIVKGSASVMFSSPTSLHVQSLLVDKPSAKLVLGSNLYTNTWVAFLNGYLDLAGKNLYLTSTGYVNGETENSRIVGNTGGEVIISVDLNAPNNTNPGNLGAFISSNSNLGAVTVKRGHKLQVGTGLPTSIYRYYEIVPTNNTALSASIDLRYMDGELNSQIESGLSFFESDNSGDNWQQKNISSRNTTSNSVVVQNLKSLARYTLGTAGALPVPFLSFTARRIDVQKVQLDWTTAQEFNNLGFYVERKKDIENAFASVQFKPSSAPGGNSSLPLSYTAFDTNFYSGKTYYRIKQKDNDGNTSYSEIRIVSGSKKQAQLLVYPVPTSDEFSVQTQGVDTDVLQVYDASGKLVKEEFISDKVIVKINGLPKGVYYIKLVESRLVQKAIVE